MSVAAERRRGDADQQMAHRRVLAVLAGPVAALVRLVECHVVVGRVVFAALGDVDAPLVGAVGPPRDDGAAVVGVFAPAVVGVVSAGVAGGVADGGEGELARPDVAGHGFRASVVRGRKGRAP